MSSPLFNSKHVNSQVHSAERQVQPFRNLRGGDLVRRVLQVRDPPQRQQRGHLQSPPQRSGNKPTPVLPSPSVSPLTKSVIPRRQLMPVIESCIHENQSMRSPFFCELTHLVRYWSRMSASPEQPDTAATYGKLMKIFWFELIAIFNRLVDNSSDNYGITTGSIVGSMAELLTYLRDAPGHSRRRNMRVKFSDSNTSSSNSSPSPVDSSVPTTPTSEDGGGGGEENAGFLKELQQLVIKLCVSYFKRITDKPFKHKVINLVKIIAGHECKELFVALARTYDESASLLQFYNQNLKILMTTESEETEALVSFIFSIMSHMPDSEKGVVLESFKEVRMLIFALVCISFLSSLR